MLILSAHLQRWLSLSREMLCSFKPYLYFRLLLCFVFFFLVSCSLYVDCRWFNSITAVSHHVLLTVLSCDIACVALVKILIDDGRKGVSAEQTKQGIVITSCHTAKRLQGMSNIIQPCLIPLTAAYKPSASVMTPFVYRPVYL